MVRQSKSEWNKQVEQVIADWDGKCYKCGKPATGVHGIHQHGTIVPVCRKCHDDIHHAERVAVKAHREAYNVVSPDAVRAAPKGAVRARAMKPSYDDIPDGC